MAQMEFEGTEIPLQEGDTIAAALYRSGVRVFSRSFKYHRPRGLYCSAGDCPNCLVTVDGEVNVRACECAARAGQKVTRQNAWPSVDRDAMAIIDKMHWALPVGFYYKAGIKPKFAWPMMEPIVRKVAGLGFVDTTDTPRHLTRVNHHPDVLVIGAGVAGLAAALAAARGGRSVLVIDEHTPGHRVAAGPTRTAIDRLAAEVAANAAITTQWNTPATGIFEGPLVVAVDPANESTLHVHPGAIVVAAGGREVHRVFAGNDLPGVMTARGAARLAGVHGLRVADRAVVWAEQPEALDHVRTLARSGVQVVAVVAPAGLDTTGVECEVVRGEVTEAKGKKRLTGVVAGGRTIACDLLAIGSEIQGNEHLVRLAYDLPTTIAGDCTGTHHAVEEAIASGTDAGERAATGLPLYQVPPMKPRGCGTDGYVCLCEDVSVKDIEKAIGEGFDSAELLKRYTTVTMGPCQGRMCADQLRAVAERVTPALADRVARATTLRPPTRPITLEQAIAGAAHHIERHTSLTETHLSLGASMMWAGVWKRVEAYNGDIQGEYKAVRERVGIIDVGTLGKFLVGGPDATAFLERLYPMKVEDLEAGRLRYALMLEEGGVIIDDGTVCALGDGRYYITVTTSGAERLESWMLDWAEAWGHDVYVVNQTASLGAINLAGPQARAVLEKLSDDPVDRESFPYIRHRNITVAGVPCLAMRLGFVGELAYELHFPASQAGKLWDALMTAGAEWDIRPFGLMAQRLLRLEKGHIIVAQDTDFETTPWKVDMAWAIKMDKPDFVGKAALLRNQKRTDRELLVPWVMSPGTACPPEGTVITVNGQLSGRITSAWDSPALGHPIGLAWVVNAHARDGATVNVGGTTATVKTGHAFYDPQGEKLRA
jgi:sarcosine oxidase subunit alpha